MIFLLSISEGIWLIYYDVCFLLFNAVNLRYTMKNYSFVIMKIIYISIDNIFQCILKVVLQFQTVRPLRLGLLFYTQLKYYMIFWFNINEWIWLIYYNCCIVSRSCETIQYTMYFESRFSISNIILFSFQCNHLILCSNFFLFFVIMKRTSYLFSVHFESRSSISNSGEISYSILSNRN